MHLGRLLVNTEARGTQLGVIEKLIKKRTTLVKIVKSVEDRKETHDDKHDMRCIDISNGTSPKLKSLMSELTAIIKTIEEDSII